MRIQLILIKRKFSVFYVSKKDMWQLFAHLRIKITKNKTNRRRKINNNILSSCQLGLSKMGIKILTRRNRKIMPLKIIKDSTLLALIVIKKVNFFLFFFSFK